MIVTWQSSDITYVDLFVASTLLAYWWQNLRLNATAIDH